MPESIPVWDQVIGENLVYIARVPAALLSLIIGYIMLRLVQRTVRTATALTRLDRTVQSMILSIVGFVGWIFILAVSLSVMHLNQLSVALGGSVALVAMALATGLNNVAQDLMAGIFLLSDKRFHVGSRVRAGGVEGVVESVSIRKTQIRTDDGWLHNVPNRNIDQNTYVVWDAEAETRSKAS